MLFMKIEECVIVLFAQELKGYMCERQWGEVTDLI
jgi:hypothetical protein